MYDDTVGVLEAVQSGFAKAGVLVVGDVMLDRYVWGTVARISPEAPVPVLHVVRRSAAAGGAANVAANLAGLGVRTTLVSTIGKDAEGEVLRSLLDRSGIDGEGLVALENRPTTTKTRIIGGHQQMLRLDEEETFPLDAVQSAALVDAVSRRLDRVSAVVLSDYAKGTLSYDACKEIMTRAKARGIPVLVDPKGLDYSKYEGATVLTPNLKELAAATRESEDDLDRLLSAASGLCGECSIEMCIVTQGERGISLVDESGIQHYPATARDVFDVSGAGDTVIAVVAACLANGLSRADAVRLANVAAGVVVGKVGTAPIERMELLAAVERKRMSELAGKIVELDQLLTRVADWRSRGDRIAFTNGCFDLIHVGHVTYLEQARREGHRLVVGLNTDHSIRRLKGMERPIVQQMDRARVVGSLASVDAVILFDGDTPINLIHAIRPDVLVKGADYALEDVVGAAEVKRWGGQVVLIPHVEGRSTSQILGRIRANA